MRATFSITLAALALTGCGDEGRKAPDPLADDPALTATLDDEIMIDADLVNQNHGNAAVITAGPEDTGLPPEPSGAQAASDARAEAAKLAGGSIRPAPEPVSGNAAKVLRDAATAAQIARAARAGNIDCAAKVGYSARWAARLPSPLEVYPRGAVVEAAGTDDDGCRLRVVHFTTPVEPGEVIDYYFTRATVAGYAARHSIDGPDRVLGGSKGGAAFVVHTRPGDPGLTQVDLVVSGG